MKKGAAAVGNHFMSNADYFTRFGLEKSYNIDTKHLKKQYLLLQAKYHPDKARSDDEKLKFLTLSIEINEAYKILNDELFRAEYLLKLAGIDLSDERRSVKSNQSILMKALSDREQLEELKNITELNRLLDNKLDEKKKIIVKLLECFNEEDVSKATDQATELKYLCKLIEEIKSKIRRINATA
ncbi:MAG: Co-chaperone protein HscB [Rickettsiaceae bacterium]|jgi:molecular chaperone HscB|nr:Co-chaperone protein HscB [Rickettsiaceae bacterium]